MSENETLDKRQVRIQCVDTPVGIATSITDVKTGEPISKAFRAVITIDVNDVNKAEITYYESDADGKLVVKDGDVVVSTAESIDPEVDITAFEVKPVPAPKHNGNLDAYKYGTDAKCYLIGSGVTIEMPGAEESCHLGAKQALSLLTWLEQERTTLERLAKEVLGD